MSGPVLFVSYTSDWTGPTNSLLHLVRHLRGRYQIAVMLAGRGPLVNALEAEGVDFVSLPNMKKKAIATMYRHIRSGGFRLVYANTSHGSSRNALIAAKLARVPFVCHVREMGWRKGWSTMGWLRLADAVVAVSEACAESIRRYAPASKTHVVHNGVPLEMPSVGRAAARAYLLEQAGLPKDAVAIASVGNVSPRKGQLEAVRMMAEAVRSDPRAHLLIIGDLARGDVGDYVAKLKGAIGELGIGHRLRLLGFRSDVFRLLEGADVFVHTARADPHPRAVIEAMSLRLPVAAFAVDGVAETVVNGQTGYLVPLGDIRGLTDSVLKLTASEALREQMGLEGRRRVEAHFTTEATAEKVARVIDGVLGSRRAELQRGQVA